MDSRDGGSAFAEEPLGAALSCADVPVVTDPTFVPIAERLLGEAHRMAQLKPAHAFSEDLRGLPAVMNELFDADGPLSPGELSKLVGVTDARIANVLRVLEGRGLVERRPSAKDRRRVEVLLSERGRAQAEAGRRAASAFTADFLAELGEDDARDLVRLLGRVNDVMETRRAEGRLARPGFCKGGDWQ